jgi:predicted flap endonuclease-1-like 5' DNA nuclease
LPADDFTQLQGIGPGIHRRLVDAGISTFARLAVCTPDELHALFGLQLAFASWIEQARAKVRTEAA